MEERDSRETCLDRHDHYLLSHPPCPGKRDRGVAHHRPCFCRGCHYAQLGCHHLSPDCGNVPAPLRKDSRYVRKAKDLHLRHVPLYPGIPLSGSRAFRRYADLFPCIPRHRGGHGLRHRGCHNHLHLPSRRAGACPGHQYRRGLSRRLVRAFLRGHPYPAYRVEERLSFQRTLRPPRDHSEHLEIEGRVGPGQGRVVRSCGLPYLCPHAPRDDVRFIAPPVARGFCVHSSRGGRHRRLRRKGAASGEPDPGHPASHDK